MLSPKNTLIERDWQKWLYNTAIFLIPVVLVLIAEAVKLIPDNWQYGALVLYLLNVATDLLRKYKEEHDYK